MRPEAVWILRGLWIGFAIVLPGISGGTAALMLGFYRRFLESLRDLRWRREIWLWSGMLAGVMLGARIVGYLLELVPGALTAFLLGLVLGVVPGVLRRAGAFTLAGVLPALVGLGAVLAFVGTSQHRGEGPASIALLLVAGAAASAVMVLPGISGSTVLVALGQYHRALEALNQLELPALAALGAGGVVGVLLLSRVTLWLLARRPRPVMAMLGGMMAGSVRCLWPARFGPVELAAAVAGLAVATLLAGARVTEEGQ